MVRMLPLKETLRMPQPELREGIFLTDWNFTSALISKKISTFSSLETVRRSIKDFTWRVLESRRSVCALLPTAYLTNGFQYVLYKGFKFRFQSYIWHSSSVLKQTFSKVWGNLLDITLDESHVSFARWKKREVHLLHSKSIPTMNIPIEGDDHDFLVEKQSNRPNVQCSYSEISTWALWL